MEKTNNEANQITLSSEIITESSNLKASDKNEDSINNSNSLIQLTNENSLNLIKKNNNNIHSNKFDYNLNIDNIQNDNSDFRPRNYSTISREIQLKIFIPLVSIKILIPVFYMLNYIIYSFENEEDQKYCKYSVWVLVSLIFLCYFLSVFTPSTQTNVDKYFDKSNNVFMSRIDNPGKELQNLNLYQWTDCAFCNSKKFVRSSHCRICNKCILLRDHHCPYIGNCVGFKNFQYFFNFLFWGDLGLIFYMISTIKFYFSSNLSKNIKIPSFLKIFQYIDLFFSCFFIIQLFLLMVNLFINLYNNTTQLENRRGHFIEYFYPCFQCKKDYSKYIIKPEYNEYNIGFLAHLYYLIGPTPFHFIFPLPKNKNYILNESCPIFEKAKMPDRLELFKYMVKNDSNNINILNNDESSPENYIKTCHQFYDGKKFI